MAASMTQTDIALDHADRITASMTYMICNGHERECYTLTVTVHSAGWTEDTRSTVHRRGHMTHAEVMGAAGRWLMAASARRTDRDARAWLLEHQTTLW